MTTSEEASGLRCDFCTGPADRLLIEDPEQPPWGLPPDPIAVRVGCAACDDGLWSAVYPIEAESRDEAIVLGRQRRRLSMRGIAWVPKRRAEETTIRRDTRERIAT